jgi:hypothetical protein
MSESRGGARAQRWFLAAFAATVAPAAVAVQMVYSRPGYVIENRFDSMGGNPSRVVDFLVANRVQGNLYNPLGWGGYLIWHLPRGIKVSIDGRSSTVYPADLLRENYEFYSNEASSDIPLRRGADFVLVEATNPVARSLDNDSRWRLVYKDNDAVLYAGPTPEGIRLAQRHRDGELALPPDARRDRFP